MIQGLYRVKGHCPRNEESIGQEEGTSKWTLGLCFLDVGAYREASPTFGSKILAGFCCKVSRPQHEVGKHSGPVFLEGFRV